MKFPYLFLAAATSAHLVAVATPVTIADNTTASLSALLTAQPGLKFTEIYFSGTVPTTGPITAVLLADRNYTTPSADSQRYQSYAGVIALQSGVTFTVQGSPSYNTGLYLEASGVLSVTAVDSTAQFAFNGNQNIGYESYGGAVQNRGKLTFDSNVAFTNNASKIYAQGSSYNAYAGAIYNAQNAVLTINGASTFSGNSVDLAHYGFGGAIYNIGMASLTSPSTFTANTAYLGGAIATGGTISLKDATFTQNTASYQGGAIYSVNTVGNTTTIDGGLFARNTSGFEGGAVYISTAAVTLTNVSFTQNTAATVGGAISNRGALNLNVGANKTATFTGNIANGVASSVFFQPTNINNAVMAVDTAVNATLDMRDPMSGTASPGSITISKSGTGVWKLGGDNGFAGGKTTFNVNAGTLYLYAADEVGNATTTDAAAKVAAGKISLTGTASIFALGSGATVIAAGDNSISATGGIALANGSKLQGGSGATKLTLSGPSALGTSAGHVAGVAAEAGSTFTLTASLSGLGGLAKTGAGTVILSGTSTYTGLTSVNEGTLKTAVGAALSSSGYSATTGATLDLSAGVQAFSGKTFTVGLDQSTAGKIITAAAQVFSSSTLTIDFGATNLSTLNTGTQWDLIDGATAANFTGVSLVSGAGTNAFSWSSGSSLWTLNLTEGQAFSFDQATGIVTVTAVPEPAAFASLLGATALAYSLRRKRKISK